MSRRSSRSRTRRRNRGRFGPLFKLLCVLAVIVALTGGATVFFRVETVMVTGSQRYTQEEIIAASGIQVGDNLYALNKVRIDRNIRTQLPYVGELSINRALPSTIVITVVEWEATAQVSVPDPDRVAALNAARLEQDPEAQPLEVAQEPWLISVKGKLLEPAPPDSTAIPVTGLTPIAPKAGGMLTVPEEEQVQLTALTGLLEALEEAELSDQVSAIRLDATQLTLRYLDRLDVLIKLDADFSYSLRLMQAVREQMELRTGGEVRGSIDLTQSKHDAVFSPEE